ncbi:MAG: exodeoxyribonuclease VII large subunit [Gemmatimonadota bacterium]
MTPPADAAPLTVSELTARVKAVLEDGLAYCWVEGEVADVRRPASGHCYLTLQDASAQLSCVMFRFYAQHLRFDPQPGMKVLVYGNVSVYERGGRYQFYIYRMQPSGVGELAVALEQLKARLAEEGLFDADRKRPLPPFPRAIGVVTSATGAAIRDIVQVLGRRAPAVRVVLRPARVQGDGAALEIAGAIDALNRHGVADILIVGRGGGAAEDLWPFNEEPVARAIYASRIPVISAVGHEVDYTIADYVADVRAPTPSAAAEVAVPDYEELRRRAADSRRRLRLSLLNRLQHLQEQLSELSAQRLAEGLGHRLAESAQRLDEAGAALAAAADRRLQSRAELFRHVALRLQALSPLRGLTRGFAYCQQEADGRPVRGIAQLAAGDHLRLRFADGSARCRVEETEHEQERR